MNNKIQSETTEPIIYLVNESNNFIVGDEKSAVYLVNARNEQLATSISLNGQSLVQVSTGFIGNR